MSIVVHLSGTQVDNVQESIEDLKSKGIDVQDIRLDEITNKKHAFFFDPDNLPLEIYEQ